MPDPTGWVSHEQLFHRGVSWKQPVRVATTANITISTALNNGDSIDGVTLATGDRVLVKDQSTGNQNGIYVVGASPARAYDMDQDGTTTVPAEEIAGAFVYVIAGTANAGKIFHTTNVAGGTLGSTTITWTEFSGGSGAPTNADYLVGTANGSLSNEIVVGTTPGGELGGTWGSPTVDTTHSGSAHSDFIAKSTANAKGDLFTATADDTPTVLPVGANDTVLMADSGQTTGLKWVASQTPSTQNYSDSAAEGSADTYARGDHKHGMPAASGAVAGLTWISSSADEDANNVQNQNHSEFTFSVVAGRWYVIQGWFLTSSNNATGDFEYSLAVSAGTMDGRGHSLNQDATLTMGANGLAVVAAANSGNVVVGTNAANDLGFPGVVVLNFAFRQNTSNGTFNLRFGVSSLSGGRIARMMKGSMFGWKEIS